MPEREFLAALVEALVADPSGTEDLPVHEAAIGHATAFVSAQLKALPFWIRVGVHSMLAMFRLESAALSGRGFSRLPREVRARSVERWAGASLPQTRQLFRTLRNLALLPYYERVHGSTASPSPAVLPPHDARPKAIKTEILIVGSGAGGSVTALELASRKKNVLVIEEGDAVGDPPPDPGATATMARLYRHRGMTPIAGSVPIAYVEGRCIGGSTEISSGFWHRPPQEATLRWKTQFDLQCADADMLRPHWEWAENTLDVGFRQAGWQQSTQVFADGARNMNWTVHEVPRVTATMSRSLIPAAMAAGAQLFSSTRVDRLVITGNRGRGAIVTHRGEQRRIDADHIFVCAGPTESPALLRRSGVTRNIGDSLRIHPMIKVAALFPGKLLSGPDTMPLLQVQQFSPEMVLGGAYFSEGHLAMLLSENWIQTRDRMSVSDRMACYYVGVRGTGRGRVRPSQIEPGRTKINYELSDQDMWNLSRGVARLAALLLEAGATEVFPAVRGVTPIRSEADAIRWHDDQLDRRAASLTTVHAFSSCPIGERQDRCAANSFGRLHGYANLYVNDASMIPDSPGVEPQGTVMTLARRNAEHFAST